MNSLVFELCNLKFWSESVFYLILWKSCLAECLSRHGYFCCIKCHVIYISVVGQNWLQVTFGKLCYCVVEATDVPLKDPFFGPVERLDSSLYSLHRVHKIVTTAKLIPYRILKTKYISLNFEIVFPFFDLYCKSFIFESHNTCNDQASTFSTILQCHHQS